MSIGIAFSPVKDQEEIKKKNYVFWINPLNVQDSQQQKIVPTHYIPFQENIHDFWQSYLKNYYENQETLKTHIYYKNNPQDEKYLSGITLDSDVYIKIDERDYIIQNTHCNGCDYFDENCQNCKTKQQQIIKVLKSKNDGEVMEMFKQCVTQYTFTPYTRDIQLIQTLCDELFNFIEDRFDFQYTQSFTKEYAKQNIILCRDNISLIKECRSYDGSNYYRYGFHIYFFNIKLNEEGKQYIKNHFNFSKQTSKQIQEYYPTTKEYEIFDKAPLTGTTALPLSATSDKIYNYYYDEEFKGLKNIKDNKEIQDLLNPFQGQYIKLKPQYVQQAVYSFNLVQLLEKHKIGSYNESIMFTLQSLKQFKEDFQFIKLLKQYKHPQVLDTLKIIKNLYFFIFDDKRVQQSLLSMQQCLYIILCENIEQIAGIQNIQNEQDWILNDDRRRGPTNVVKAIQDFHNKADKGFKDKNIAYKDLFDDYNKYKINQKLDEEIIEFDPIIQISYRNFNNFVSLYANGTYIQLFPILVLKKSNSSTIKDILFRYIYDQLEQGIIVSGQQYYYFQEKHQIYDHNKYHLLQEGDIEGRITNILNKLSSGIDSQQKILQQNYNNYQMYIRYQQMSAKEKLNCFENDLDDEQKEYINQSQFYVNLKDIICEYGKKCKDKNTVKEIVVEKLSKQGQHQQMDQQQNCFGVFNGVLEFEPVTKTFQFHQGNDARQFYVSRSTMFNVRDEFIDENSKIKSPELLPPNLKVKYDEIVQIYNTIYKKGNDIDVFYWQVFNIIYRLLDKNTPGEKLLISFGTGSDGKTTAKQAVCFTLGQGQQQLTYGRVNRKIISNGYTSQVDSTVLQTKKTDATKHGTGGFIELQGCYFALMSELAGDTPLVSSVIKNMLAGTQMTSRRAYDKDVQTFQNTCFLELQTNNYPTFDDVLDDGLKRRVLFYQHDVKFVSQTIYDSIIDPQQKESCQVGNENIRNKLNSDPDYIDLLGLYLLTIFQQYQGKIDYIPDILIRQSEKFFGASLKYMKLCLDLIKTNPTQIEFTVYSKYEEVVRGLITQNETQGQKKKQADILKLQENHLKIIKDVLMQNFIAVNLDTKKWRYISINEFQQVQADQKCIILIKGYSFVNDAYYTESQQLLPEFNFEYQLK